MMRRVAAHACFRVMSARAAVWEPQLAWVVFLCGSKCCWRKVSVFCVCMGGSSKACQCVNRHLAYVVYVQQGLDVRPGARETRHSPIELTSLYEPLSTSRLKGSAA
jgi:hypothetical protein